jgi:hypothetical protein
MCKSCEVSNSSWTGGEPEEGRGAAAARQGGRVGEQIGLAGHGARRAAQGARRGVVACLSCRVCRVWQRVSRVVRMRECVRACGWTRSRQGGGVVRAVTTVRRCIMCAVRSRLCAYKALDLMVSARSRGGFVRACIHVDVMGLQHLL